MTEASERFAKIKVSGNTFPVKETLKAAGFKWDKNHWSGSLEESRLVNFKKFIFEYGLKCEIGGNSVKNETIYGYRKKETNSLPYLPSVYGEGKLNNF
jgi:hypothetical protein